MYNNTRGALMSVKYITSFLILLFTLTGCEVVVSPSYPGSITPYPAPYLIQDARATCYWDNWYQDYVWEFDAWIDNYYGPREVAEVWVDVYQGPHLVDSIPLNPQYGNHWSTHRIEWSETNLYCGDIYDVEFVAYDWNGFQDILITHVGR